MASTESTTAPAWLRPLVDYGPLVAFFAVYWLGGLTAATIAIMAATAVALALAFIFERRIPPMPPVTAALVGVFGGLPLWPKHARASAWERVCQSVSIPV